MANPMLATFDIGTKDPRRFGGRGEAKDANGNIIPGTSGAQAEIDRSRGMAWNPVHKSAVGIDQTRSNETRGIQGGALGMLRARAEGGITPAQQLAASQTQGAVNGVYSGAASVKGGAGARAQAARGAVATGAQVAGQGAQDLQALRARERADAAGQYLGAAGAQRGQDLTLAGDQAKLEAEHRAAQDQREQFYEAQAFGAGNADNTAKLGGNAQDVAAANTAAGQRLSDQTANRQFGATLLGAGLAGASGAAAAYGNTTQPAAAPPVAPPPLPPNPYADDNYYGGLRH